MPRKAKKGSPRYYFTQKTEDAIIRYNKEERAYMKERIYNDHIRRAFDKLCENIIHTFKFYYFDVPSEQVKQEVISFLVLNMHKFKEGKGKAFSYFSIVAKNYLILHNNKNYAHYKSHDTMDVLDWNSRNKDEMAKKETDESLKEYVGQFVEYWENNITNVFTRKKDILVADSVLEIFRRAEHIENFNKKALYIMIREMSGSKTQHITRIVNTMKKYHQNLSREYMNNGELDTASTGSFL
tara:strand:- start:1015 stop:1734 length:720 start_codon:yes stop_codon:yes gene_type:complete